MAKQETETLRRASRVEQANACAEDLRELIDPFNGFFRDPIEDVREYENLLKTRIARKLFRIIEWGMRSDLYTFQQPLKGLAGPRAQRGNSEFLILSSYDYLGLIGHPALTSAVIGAVNRYGTGTGGVRLLTGTAEIHVELESAIARFLGTEAAITFSSGYTANIGLLSALLGPRDIVLVDALIHRSLLDGCRLSGAERHSFSHNDTRDLRRLLETLPQERRIFIIVEGLYSMEGDICPLPEIVALKEEFNAHLIIDEAHSLGVLGQAGRGVTEHFGIEPGCIDIITGSLSKAIPASGGFIAGSQELIIFLQHVAAPFFFSAALSPIAAAVAKTAIEIIEAEPDRIERLWRNAAMLRNGLDDLDFDFGNSCGPIIPVVLGKEETAYRLCRELLREGVVTTAVVYPAVPKGSARLRLCATAAHRQEDILEAIKAFENFSGFEKATNE